MARHAGDERALWASWGVSRGDEKMVCVFLQNSALPAAAVPLIGHACPKRRTRQDAGAAPISLLHASAGCDYHIEAAMYF
jgi:hypothetical protein